MIEDELIDSMKLWAYGQYLSAITPSIEYSACMHQYDPLGGSCSQQSHSLLLSCDILFNGCNSKKGERLTEDTAS
jgi:hypothetical protein